MRSLFPVHTKGCHGPVLSQHTRQWPLQAADCEPPPIVLLVVHGWSDAVADGFPQPGCAGRQLIRHHVDGEGVVCAEGGGDNTPAALKDHGRHCSDGARANGTVAIKPSLGRLPEALRERDAVTDGHAPWAPGRRPLAAGEALNRSPLPSESKERCFLCSGSTGHSAVPFQGRRGVSQIRTHPYTPTCARVCEPFRQAARHRSVKSGSRWRATPCSAHGVIRRISLIFSQEMIMEETLHTGMRLRKAGAWAAAPGAAPRRIWDTGSWAGTWAICVMVCYISERVGSRPGTGSKCQRGTGTDRAPVAGMAQAASVVGD